MCRVLTTALVSAVTCLCGGCDPQTRQNPAVPMPGILAPADDTLHEVPPGIGGLQTAEPAPQLATKKADEYRTKEEVEIWLRQSLKLAQVTLTAQAEHGFSGNGLGFDSRQYTLTVKQVPGGIKCWFRDNVGGSGDMAFGKLAEEPKAFAPE
ncbi:MAG TPA: hypothetical protein VFB96_06530 [Pirellulaceae bacterium]|nr:hypothetical protein [Pirellulaceae bacterium]